MRLMKRARCRRHDDFIPGTVSTDRASFYRRIHGVAMKAETIAVLLAASAASSAVPAFAHDCGAANMQCESAVKHVSHKENSARAVHGMRAKSTGHEMPDAAKTPPIEHEQHDSIDAWYRGG
jgi:hypothetical protein